MCIRDRAKTVSVSARFLGVVPGGRVAQVADVAGRDRSALVLRGRCLLFVTVWVRAHAVGLSSHALVSAKAGWAVLSELHWSVVNALVENFARSVFIVEFTALKAVLAATVRVQHLSGTEVNGLASVKGDDRVVALPDDVRDDAVGVSATLRAARQSAAAPSADAHAHLLVELVSQDGQVVGAVLSDHNRLAVLGQGNFNVVDEGVVGLSLIHI